MVSQHIREVLLAVSSRSDDGEQPLINAWLDLRVSMDDADDLCTCIELADAVSQYHAKYGQRQGDAMLKTLIRLLTVTATIETINIIEARRARAESDTST